MSEGKFKTAAWTTLKGNLSLTHLVHKGEILCACAPLQDSTIGKVGRGDCFYCNLRGRSIQQRGGEQR